MLRIGLLSLLCLFGTASFVSADTCCQRAKAAGIECDHLCCAKARKEKKVCEKCNSKDAKKPKNSAKETEKKESKL